VAIGWEWVAVVRFAVGLEHGESAVGADAGEGDEFILLWELAVELEEVAECVVWEQEEGVG